MINIAAVTKFFLGMLFLKALIQSYLDLRNRKYISAHAGEVPVQFKDKITLDEHQKAAAYSLEKLKIGQIFRSINLFILLGWTVAGGLNFLDILVSKLVQGTYLKAVVFLTCFSLISMLISLPQSLYQTFVLEEKYGFNRTDAKTFCLDIIKGLFLGAILGFPIFLLLIYLVENINFWWLYGWAALSIFQLIILFIYPRFIAPLFNKFSPLEEGQTKMLVEELLDQAGFKSKGLFVMDASKRSNHGNAYFTGFGKEKRIVFFDTLLKGINPPQVKAILAHELGHFKKKHVLKGLLRSLATSLIGFAILGYFFKEPLFHIAHGVGRMEPYLTLILFAMVSPIYTFFTTPISSYFSRKQEFEADAFACEYSDPQDLVDALLALYKENASTLTPDPFYSQFYYSHPPAVERVEHLLTFKEPVPN